MTSVKPLSYPEYLEKLTQATDELEVAEEALWEEARRDGQANPAIPLIVRPGTAIEAAEIHAAGTHRVLIVGMTHLNARWSLRQISPHRHGYIVDGIDVGAWLPDPEENKSLSIAKV